MTLTWHPWLSVSEGRTIPGALVTAIPHDNLFTLFIADPSGGVYTVSGSPTAGWGPWSSVSEGRTTPGGTISAVTYGNRIALFLADPNGGIYTAVGTPDGGWSGWSSVSEGRAKPGAPVTPILFGDRVALFLADPNGGVYTTAGYPGGNWGPWASVSEGSTVPGSLITAVPRPGQPTRFELFLTDPNGGIYTVSGNPEQGWGPWSAVTNTLISPGSPITAIQLGSEVVLFSTDAGGKVVWSSGTPETQWKAWIPVSQGISLPHSPVTAVALDWLGGEDQYALLISDPNGGIYASVGDAYQVPLGWGPWASVSDGRAAPGAPVTALPFGNHVAVFLADPNGGIYTAYSRYDPPASPLNLRETAVSANSIGVAWDDNTNDAAGFRISFNGVRTGQGNHQGEVSAASNQRAATLSNLLSGWTYTISMLAFNSAGNSGASNSIVVTTPIAPQIVSVTMTVSPVEEGPLSYVGQYPPGFGTVPAGHLLQIALPQSAQVLGFSFVKIGHSTEECGNSDAVVTVLQASHTTPAQLTAIYGAAKPSYSSSSPIPFVACISLAPGASIPHTAEIELTIISDVL